MATKKDEIEVAAHDLTTAKGKFEAEMTWQRDECQVSLGLTRKGNVVLHTKIPETTMPRDVARELARQLNYLCDVAEGKAPLPKGG